MSLTPHSPVTLFIQSLVEREYKDVYAIDTLSAFDCAKISALAYELNENIVCTEPASARIWQRRIYKAVSNVLPHKHICARVQLTENLVECLEQAGHIQIVPPYVPQQEPYDVAVLRVGRLLEIARENIPESRVYDSVYDEPPEICPIPRGKTLQDMVVPDGKFLLVETAAGVDVYSQRGEDDSDVCDDETSEAAVLHVVPLDEDYAALVNVSIGEAIDAGERLMAATSLSGCLSNVETYVEEYQGEILRVLILEWKSW